MTVKCAMFKAERKSMPTYSDIDKAQPKGAKVIYGGGKRKTSNIPYLKKLHLVEHSFQKFESYISVDEEDAFYTKELFIFQDGANELLLKLRYAKEIVAVFEIDEAIIDNMHHCQWSHDWIERQIQSLNGDIGNCKFFEEKNVGDVSLHKKFPAHIKSIQKMIADYEKAEEKIVQAGKKLFTCGW